MLLYYEDYKKYIINNYDIINEILKKNYNYFIKVEIREGIVFLVKKWIKNQEIYEYDEYDSSLEYIDRYIKKYINFFLFSHNRQRFLLDTVKKVWGLKKAENIVIETIQK